MTHEEKAIAVAYAKGVMDTLKMLVRAMMAGDESDKDMLDSLVVFTERQLDDLLEEDGHE